MIIAAVAEANDCVVVTARKGFRGIGDYQSICGLQPEEQPPHGQGCKIASFSPAPRCSMLRGACYRVGRSPVPLGWLTGDRSSDWGRRPAIGILRPAGRHHTVMSTDFRSPAVWIALDGSRSSGAVIVVALLLLRRLALDVRTLRTSQGEIGIALETARQPLPRRRRREVRW